MMYFILGVSAATLVICVLIFYKRDDTGRALLKQVNDLKAQMDYFVTMQIPRSDPPSKGRVIRKTDEEVYKSETKVVQD